MTENDNVQGSEIDQCLSMLRELKEGLLESSFAPGLSDLLLRAKQRLSHHSVLRDEIPDIIARCRDAGDLELLKRKQYGSGDEWEHHVRMSLNRLSDLLDGDKIAFDRYEILKQIGNGGYGQVYRVRHKLLGRDFAIKVLNPIGGGDETDQKRFFQEAEMLYELNHSGIIRIFELGLVGRRPYIVMEYVSGRDLNKALLEMGRIGAAEALAVIEAVARAIQHAHERGIVHRDLKPSNILTDGLGQIRVIDFGLGIYIEQALESRITETGRQPAGGPYTAPELRQNPKLIDARSDVFSLGAVWFELVTGGAPGGSNLAAILRDVEGLSRRHQDAILMCLENADVRFQSCNDVLDYLGEKDSDTVDEGRGRIAALNEMLEFEQIAARAQPLVSPLLLPIANARGQLEESDASVEASMINPAIDQGLIEKANGMVSLTDLGWEVVEYYT